MLLEKPIREWLVQFELASSLEDADYLCHIGSIRLDGRVFTNAHHCPPPGSILCSMYGYYDYQIPETSLNISFS
jgi:hypothetical protein